MIRAPELEHASERQPVHPSWRQRRAAAIAVCLCLASPLGFAQTDPLTGPEFIDATAGVLPDGRFHALIQMQVPSSGHELRVTGARRAGDAIEVQVVAERDPAIPDLPAIMTKRLPVTLENLPPGDYAVRVGDDEIAVAVPEERRFRQPMTARWWPAEPSGLDPLWLVFEPREVCADYQLVQFSASPTSRYADLLLREVPAPCPAANEPPRLAAIPVGQVDPGDYTVTMTILRDGEQGGVGSIPHDAVLALHVGDGFSPTLGGTWYDPAQSGHGVTFEVIEDGRVLLYWFTFDTEGRPAWVMAEGHPAARGVTLSAHITSGGFFPPFMDPDQVQRHPWGQIELSFDRCDRGTMNWRSDQAGFRNGSMPLERLTERAGDGCHSEPSPVELLPDWYQGPGSFVRLAAGD